MGYNEGDKEMVIKAVVLLSMANCCGQGNKDIILNFCIPKIFAFLKHMMQKKTFVIIDSCF